eukprot:TRINITY_DN599_c0_g1_i3.p1 TRINITY_DN599_c0_g1~~TRINITY_DN599_c0_g1_i3.p1  ORF type:complete len:264 (+),score=26.02 TRINITY_DN599_c0_g1_i3:98-889(+)
MCIRDRSLSSLLQINGNVSHGQIPNDDYMYDKELFITDLFLQNKEQIYLESPEVSYSPDRQDWISLMPDSLFSSSIMQQENVEPTYLSRAQSKRQEVQFQNNPKKLVSKSVTSTEETPQTFDGPTNKQFPFKVIYKKIKKEKYDTKNIVKNLTRALVAWINTKSPTSDISLDCVQKHNIIRDVGAVIKKHGYTRHIFKHIFTQKETNSVFVKFLKTSAFEWIIGSPLIKDKISLLRARRNLIYVAENYKTIPNFTWDFQYKFV